MEIGMNLHASRIEKLKEIVADITTRRGPNKADFAHNLSDDRTIINAKITGNHLENLPFKKDLNSNSFDAQA